MSRCEAEMCPNWTGDGCLCAVMDGDPDAIEQFEMADVGMTNQYADWRVGQHYGIHVYEGDRPVATFHTVEDAHLAVAAHNDAARVAGDAARQAAALARVQALADEMAQYRELDRAAPWVKHLRAALDGATTSDDTAHNHDMTSAPQKANEQAR